jgi:hypothetical protein
MSWNKLMNSEAKSFLTFFVLGFLLCLGIFTNQNLTLTIAGCILLFLIAILFILFVGWFIYFSGVTKKYPLTDISRYQEALNYGSHTKHFPEEIPVDATDVIFYYSPCFLQGGSLIQLRMKLLPKRIEEIQTLFRKNAKLKYIPGCENNSLKYETSPQGTIIPHEYCFYTGDTLKYDFPENYEILVLEDERCAPKYKYSRGVWYGIAIDISTSEVVYWAEIGGG